MASHVARYRKAALQTCLEGVPATTEENHVVLPARQPSLERQRLLPQRPLRRTDGMFPV